VLVIEARYYVNWVAHTRFEVHKEESEIAMSTRRIIIDTDGGADDAVAIMMALRHPDIQVEAITTVADNVTVDQATINVLYVLEYCGEAGIPVYKGRHQALIRRAADPDRLHGKSVFGSDGLGDIEREAPSLIARPEHACHAIIEQIMSQPDEISIVALGPLSNIALSVLIEPRIVEKVQHIYMMGGVVNALGNVSPSAESNVWADPEAAEIVLQAEPPITMIGWELVWGEMLITAKEMERFRRSGSRMAKLAMDCSYKVAEVVERLVGEPGLPLPDAIAMATVIDPSICKTRHLYVAVETRSDLTRGETVVDEWGILSQRPNVNVCFEPDAQKYKKLLYDLLLPEISTKSAVDIM